jgi:hypothetical protein
MSLESREPRHIRDPRTMRALAHPLRLQLLELAAREGSLTSTRAAELTGESTASCSFHLRQLAKYGFLEDAGGGKGRERPWRVAQVDTRWSETPGDPVGAAAADALTGELLGRDLAELDRYRRTRREHPPEWQDAGLLNTSLLFLSPAELEELLEHQMIFVRARLDRTYDPAARPADARPVRFVSFAVPVDGP